MPIYAKQGVGIIMRHYGDRVGDLHLAYIGGGSRGWAWGLMSDLASEQRLGGEVRLFDIDHESSQLNAAIGNKISALPETKGAWAYKSVDTLEEALERADFVVISILPGTFDEMSSDVHEPEKYGIHQSVGDTTGPGGLVRALRTVPMYVDFARAIREHAPEAWVINYTNPMTLCLRTLYEIFPGIKAFGCCHEVFGTQELLSLALAEMRGIKKIPRVEIRVNVKGVNHFTWIDQAAYEDLDLLGVYREFAGKYRDSGYDPGGEKTVFSSMNMVKFDLFHRYGLIAAAGDRHLAEFLPPWYLKDPATVERWGFCLTPVAWRIEDRQHKVELQRRLAGGSTPAEIKSTGEEGVRQMAALLGLDDFTTNVNLPNRGQIPGLPLGAVVESNARFCRNSVQPLFAGALPPLVHNLVARQVWNQEAALRAALEKDFALAFNVFLNDPLVTLGLDDAGRLFRSMLANTREYLPGWIV